MGQSSTSKSVSFNSISASGTIITGSGEWCILLTVALLNLSGSGDINQLGQIRGLETCVEQPLELLTAGDILLTPEKDFFEAWKIYPWAVSSCLPLLCPVSVSLNIIQSNSHCTQDNNSQRTFEQEQQNSIPIHNVSVFYCRY